MRRSSLMGSVLVLALVTPMATWASGRTSIGISVNIGNAPPPPVVVVREQPHCVIVPGSTVYVVQHQAVPYDMFRYGVFWYIYSDGYWYRARKHRGPYEVVAIRYVPRAILNVPARHWKHHPHGGPPGQAKKHRDHVVVVKEKGRGRH